jgi:hypothetical protein
MFDTLTEGDIEDFVAHEVRQRMYIVLHVILPSKLSGAYR